MDSANFNALNVSFEAVECTPLFFCFDIETLPKYQRVCKAWNETIQCYFGASIAECGRDIFRIKAMPQELQNALGGWHAVYKLPKMDASSIVVETVDCIRTLPVVASISRGLDLNGNFFIAFVMTCSDDENRPFIELIYTSKVKGHWQSVSAQRYPMLEDDISAPLVGDRTIHKIAFLCQKRFVCTQYISIVRNVFGVYQPAGCVLVSLWDGKP